MTKITQSVYHPNLEELLRGKPSKKPEITLVGAGPGDPDLITRKGLNALRSADVILYDALVHPDLLAEAAGDAVKIYVGKRAGRHSLSQERINDLLVEAALRCGHAVRLKGGDPFVFGRGYEEKIYAEQRGIPVTVIPGISSANSLPAINGVPLTHRGLSQSFWVMTARAANGALPADIELAARSEATVVLLMGLARLERILEVYRSVGKADLPVMIIQNGSRKNEKCWVGTVNDIAGTFHRERDAGPGIIVLGQVVGLRTQQSRAEVIEAVESMATLKSEK
ncbi:uroporphyrinogen-III C-methyltransferase [Lewinellaceae bacterium SD302]|nr:uroporphyrinogen-III C-methyltransferase [Lewinellaceae bacterium SD302]